MGEERAPVAASASVSEDRFKTPTSKLIKRTDGHRDSFYPTYSWEEPDEPGIGNQGHQDLEAKARVSTAMFGHDLVSIPGKVGIMPDTGAVFSLSGTRFVRQQSAIASYYGKSTQWSKLAKPRQVAGVGRVATPCHYQAALSGFTVDGHPLSYTAPVIPPDDGED